MTRKHFEAIAKAVRYSDVDGVAKLVVASNLAAVLAPFNDRFEAGRFIRACVGADAA